MLPLNINYLYWIYTIRINSLTSDEKKFLQIIWKKDNEILFLGLLDMTGESGMSVSSRGMLHLTGSVPGRYICYIQHPETFQEIPVTEYVIILSGKISFRY